MNTDCVAGQWLPEQYLPRTVGMVLSVPVWVLHLSRW